MAEFVAVRDLETDWEPVFARDDIGQVLLRSDEKLVAVLESAGWAPTHKDDDYVVLRP